MPDTSPNQGPKFERAPIGRKLAMGAVALVAVGASIVGIKHSGEDDRPSQEPVAATADMQEKGQPDYVPGTTAKPPLVEAQVAVDRMTEEDIKKEIASYQLAVDGRQDIKTPFMADGVVTLKDGTQINHAAFFSKSLASITAASPDDNIYLYVDRKEGKNTVVAVDGSEVAEIRTAGTPNGQPGLPTANSDTVHFNTNYNGDIAANGYAWFAKNPTDGSKYWVSEVIRPDTPAHAGGPEDPII